MQDMSSRELLQERRMLPNGDTIWEDSCLVEAAKQGQLCVLDGVHRLHASALELLQSLVLQRTMHLADGSRLVEKKQFQQMASMGNLTSEQLNAR